MAEPETASSATAGDDNHNNPNNNPLLSLLSSFLQLFKLQPPKPAASDESEVAKDDGGEVKPAVVKFPRSELPSLKLEAHEAETDTNPVVLWQVYAIGGFFVLKWAWSRWNERRGKKRPSNEEPQPPPPPPPHDD